MAMGQPARSRACRKHRRNDRVMDRTQPFDRMKIDDREIKFFLLPSPSGRAISNSEAINIYQTVLFGA
jgi:hypothetical protein